MRCRLLIWVALVSSVLVVNGPVLAQTTSDQPKESPSLLDRLDNLGRRIFGDGRTTDRERNGRCGRSCRVRRTIRRQASFPRDATCLNKQTSGRGGVGVARRPATD